MGKEKSSDAYLRFLLSETAKDQPVNEAGVLSNARDSLLSKFAGTAMGQRAQGRLDASQLARELKQAWSRYAGQMHGMADAEPTPRNIQTWLKRRYDVDLELTPNAPAAQAASQPQPEPEAQTSAEDEVEPTGEPQADSAAADAEPQSAVEQEIANLKKVILTRFRDPDAKILEPGSRSPEQYLNYLRMGLQAFGLDDPRTGKPPFGEPLSDPVGRAMAKVTTDLARGADEQMVKASIAALKSAVTQSPSKNDDAAVAEYLNDVFADPQFQRMHPFLRDLKKQHDEDEKFANSPAGKLPPERLFNTVAVKAVQFKEARGSPSQRVQAEFITMVSALCQRALQQPQPFREKVTELLDGFANDPTLLKRFPALQAVLNRYRELQTESVASPYVTFLFEANGCGEFLAEQSMDLDGRLTGKLLDRFFMFVAQQLLASQSASRDSEEPARGPSPKRAGGPRNINQRRFNPVSFADILRDEADEHGIRFDQQISMRIIKLIQNRDWDNLDRLVKTLDATHREVVIMAAAKALQ